MITNYFTMLKQIKEKGPVEFTTIYLQGNAVKLQLVDQSDETINLLTEWRNKYWDAFPAKFNATKNGTKKWIQDQVLEKPDRILFMIILGNDKIGHIGTYRYNTIDNSAEIDNVVRAIRKGYPGLMEKITKFMISWMFKELKLSKIQLKVFSDNYKAINLYERCGMLTVGNIPLKRIQTEDGWKWDETQLNEGEYADRYFSIMEITPSTQIAKD